MRNAAMRAAGWNGDHFQALYNYFSAHSHVAPVSYFRLERHKIGFMDVSDAQKGMAILGLNVGEFCLVRTSLEYLRSDPSEQSKFDASELAAYSAAVQRSTVLGN
jgi:hypothetical protein